jgi:hypothetical protein
MGLGRGAGRDIGGTCPGLNHADGDENIKDAEAADDAAERRMEQKQADRHGQMAQEIVLLPEIGPGEIEEKSAHLQTKDD